MKGFDFMKRVRPQIIITDHLYPNEIRKKIEMAGRTCYQSNDDRKTDTNKFISNLIKRGHTSVLEHVSLSFRVITDRGISHELVRHRIASYSQESTRYCKYGNDVQFIVHINDPFQSLLDKVNQNCEIEYNMLILQNAPAQIARQALNNNVKTEVYCTMNLRSLRNFFELRCAPAAHPYMKELAIPFLLEMKDQLSPIFDDIQYDEKFYEERLKDYLLPVVTYDCEYDMNRFYGESTNEATE